jgi:hypothetical protein
MVYSLFMSQNRPRKYLTKSRKIKLTSDAMSALGSIGGKARAAKLSPEDRRKIAVKASKAAAKARTAKAAERRKKTT